MHTHPEDEFLSCDWGTSSFRLRSISKGTIRQEYSDAVGCKSIFSAHPANQAARAGAFENQLRTTLATFAATSCPVPLLISGMASSTIGWVEIPYAHLPLDLDATNLRVKSVDWKSPPFISKTCLISGAASENEMMRGEETEAIGLLNSISPPDNTLLILPGTHSKHLTVDRGQITRIQTFMTGELYELLTNHSVLRASVDSTMPQVDLEAFDEGIRCAVDRSLAGALFQTRTRQVLQRKSPRSNASFLSGVLIGAELHHLKELSGPLFIAGADPVRDLYTHAAKQLGLRAQTFTSEQVQLAVPRAHQLILSHLAAR